MKPWTTLAQREYLEEQVPQHLQHSAANKIHLFWPILYAGFFMKFPESDVEPAIDPTTGKPEPTIGTRLQSWFNNHSGARRKTGGGGMVLGDASTVARPSDTGTSRKKNGLAIHKQERAKADYIAYQTLYWDTKLRKPVMDEWEKYRSTLPCLESEQHKYLQAFRNRRCKELLAEETTAIQEEVDRVRKMGKGQFTVLKGLKEQAEASLGENAGPEEVEAKKREMEELSRKQAMQSYIDQIPNHVGKMLRDIYQKTGFVATVMFGGAYPNLGGEVRGHIYHTELPDRRTFETSMPTFHESVAKPFAAFINSVYTTEMRRGVALPSASSHTPQLNVNSPPTASTTASAPTAAALPTQSLTTQPTSSSAPPLTTPAQSEPLVPKTVTSTSTPADPPAPAAKTQPKPRPTNKNPSTSVDRPVGPLLPGQMVPKTAYEAERNANIARNHQMLVSLGLDGGAKAMFQPVERKKSAKVIKDKGSPEEPTRRSKRIKNGPDSAVPTGNDENQEPLKPNEDELDDSGSDNGREEKEAAGGNDNDESGGGKDPLSGKVPNIRPSNNDTLETSSPSKPQGDFTPVPVESITMPETSSTNVLVNITNHAPASPTNPVTTSGTLEASSAIDPEGTRREDPERVIGEAVSRPVDTPEQVEGERCGGNDEDEDEGEEEDDEGEEEGEEGEEEDNEGAEEEGFVDGVPEDMPDYLGDIWEYLVGASGAEDWDRAMKLWVRLERDLGYPQGRGKSFEMAVVKRPAEVGAWIKRGHPEADIEDIPYSQPSVDKFGQKVRNWWTVLQPASRGNEWPLLRDIKGDETWPELRKGGKNGFKLIMVALNWWLRGTSSESEENKALSMLEDVVFVLERILETTAVGKRKAEEHAGGDAKRAKLSV